MMIAGHDFDDGVQPVACRYCGYRLLVLLGATEADVGAPDVAHTGNLSRGEFEEIESYRNRLWDTVGSAVQVG